MTQEDCDRCLRKNIAIFMVGFYMIFVLFLQPLIEDILPREDPGLFNAWHENEPFDLKVYLSTYERLDFSKPKSFKELATVENISYNLTGFFSDELYTMNYTLSMNDRILTNKTERYIIVVGSPSRCHFREMQTTEGTCLSISQKANLIHWERQKVDLRRNLLKDKAVEIVPEEERPIVPYYFGNITFDIVCTQMSLYDGKPRPHNYMYMLSDGTNYIPFFSEDEFMYVENRKNYINITNPPENINYTITITMKPFWLWDKKLEFDTSYREMNDTYIRKQWEDIKRAMWDTKPILLWTYIILSISHVILKFMAFREDIGWWQDQKSLYGVSVQSVIFEAISQLVILLYLKDENTNIIIIATRLIGLVIQLWKLTKLFTPIMEFPYFKTKSTGGDETREFDKAAGSIFAKIFIPMLVGYSLYSLYNYEYKSFYSFILKASVGGIYAFGFLAMFPQIYVNYKLKSVAGMSGTVLAFKFVSTFIDDVFAFIMPMPLMHRLACFRDDIVFFIWLYQRHIYRIDPTRANEYGEVIDKEAREKFAKEMEEINEEVTVKKDEEEDKEEKEEKEDEITQRKPTEKAEE